MQPVAGPSSGNRKRDRQHLDDDDDDVRAPIPQKRETLVEPGKWYFIVGLQFSLSSEGIVKGFQA